MLGMRRYRIYLLIAALTAGTLYYLVSLPSSSSTANDYSITNDGTRPDLGRDPTDQALYHAPVEQPLAPKQDSTPPQIPTIEDVDKELDAPTTAAERGSTTSQPTSTASVLQQVFSTLEEKPPSSTLPAKDQPGDHSRIESEKKIVKQDIQQPSWHKTKPQYPLAAEDIIPLPKGRPTKLPRIQHDFDPETAWEGADRVHKLGMVKAAFKHAWDGYRKYALPHDELKPISKGFGDPFMGWGATLVDTLDTLWIMGFHTEFEKALEDVAKIDFKTSPRKDIPLFETVIRYLGGLIASYDISSHEYPVLLTKAEELAEVLMDAFDTPNRMPDLFHRWDKSLRTEPHQSNTNAVLAELGSLSMEFTRLAQITGKHHYYDAIARITNELEKWQMETDMPGLWPLKLDASGCKKPKPLVQQASPEKVAKPGKASYVSEDEALNGEEPAYVTSEQFDDESHLTERQVSVDEPYDFLQMGEKDSSVDCIPQSLTTELDAESQTFGIGGQADSTYEYFPKQYALLGGLNKQYRTMYVNAMNAIRKELLFKPMIEDESRDILFVAKHELSVQSNRKKRSKKTTYEVTHLSCFAGGMFALGAKVFGLQDDLMLARKLTDGCVWAYESMPVGIMAESAEMTPCDGLDECAWNKTRWHEAVDQQYEERLAAVVVWNRLQSKILEQSQTEALKGVNDIKSMARGPIATPTSFEYSKNVKRQEVDLADEEPSRTSLPLHAEGDYQEASYADKFVPKIALSHQDYVKIRIREERLPPGYTSIDSRDYRLRPEAIESVFIMYRITGDQYWRKKGWQMFNAVQSVTHTEVGNAALRDVTSQLMELNDSMESFWLAETLKYYYLLFSEPDVVSLDDYVLNTEAHPFMIPK